MLPRGQVFATLLGRDTTWDLAALRIDRPEIEPVQIAHRHPSQGDLLTYGGYGQDAKLVLGQGKALGYAMAIGTKSHETLRLSGRVRDGDSGGPIFDRYGHLVAVLWGTTNSQVSGTYCGRIRRFLAQFTLGVDAWKRQVGLGCLAPPLPGPDRPPKPNPPTPCPVITPPQPIDYDVLAARVVKLMACDPRFRGAQGTTGEPGPSGPRGSQGPPGAAGSLTMSEAELEALADKLGPLLGFYVRFEDAKKGPAKVQAVHLARIPKAKTGREIPDEITIRSPLPE